MKFRKLLIFSLITNLGLLALVMYRFTVDTKQDAAGLGRKTNFAAATNSGNSVVLPETNQNWELVKSNDLKQYIKNLQGIGCPEETVRDIIVSEVNKTYAARWRAMNGTDGKKFWLSKRDGWWGHTKQKEFNALEREKKELIQSLLGINADEQLRKYLVLNYDASVEVREMDFLPDSRKEAVNKQLNEDDRMIQAIWLKQEPGGSLPQSAQHELNVALQKRKQDLVSLLSADEQEEYELRNSTLAKDLRRQLYGFDASEKEFRIIFKAQKTARDQIADLPFSPTDEKTIQKRGVISEVAEKKLLEQLGAQRYADYQRARTTQYQQLLNFIDEFESPKEVADQAYEIIKGANEKLKEVQNDSALSFEQKQTKLAALQTETDDALKKAMGEKGLAYYKQNFGGWMAAGKR